MQMRISAKAGVPLAEIILAIGIFACTGILTVRLFLTASYMERFTSDTNTALMKAQSVIEYVKAGGEIGDKGCSALNIRKTAGEGCYEQSFDRDWNVTEQNPVFMMKVTVSKKKMDSGTVASAHVSIKRCQSYPFLKAERDQLADLSDQQYFTE